MILETVSDLRWQMRLKISKNKKVVRFKNGQPFFNDYQY